MKKALITDWVEKFGGAERVVKSICELYKFDYYYAYADFMRPRVKIKVFNGKAKIKYSRVLRVFGKKFRYAMPFFPMIVEEFNDATKKNKVDLVISSSWALSKGFRHKGAVHVCYLQARNFKYIWDESHLYFKGPLSLLSFTKLYLRHFDVKSAQNPDILIANSRFVQQWVKKHYKRDSLLIYPPVDVEDFHISTEKEDYYITVGRLEPYKRFDIIVDAFNKNGKKLIIAGSGSQLEELKELANDNISFIGFVEKERLNKELQKAKAFVYAGVEDFGIAIVEALASGVPVIGYKGGAMQEIVEHGIDGMVFEKQSAMSLNGAIHEFECNFHTYDAHLIKSRADRFSDARFKKEFKTLIDSIQKEFRN